MTAWTVVNQWPQGELRRILTQYGEERHAGAIASAIVRAREQAPIATTGQLVEVIRRAMPAAALREKQHPAKRSFQAIRIAVNDELGSVSRMLQQAIPRLRPGGRLAVISFHSLEDRIVKSGLCLSPLIPSVRVRQATPGASGQPEAHPPQSEGNRRESPGQKRETAPGRETGPTPRKPTRRGGVNRDSQRCPGRCGL